MKKRERLYALYGGHCAYCGKPIGIDTTTIDHIIPKSKGGSNVESNLLPACRPCNLQKGDKSLEEFRKIFFKAHPQPGKKFYFECRKKPAAPTKRTNSEENALIEELLLQNAYLIYCMEHIHRNDGENNELGFFLRIARKKNQEFKAQFEKNMNSHP